MKIREQQLLVLFDLAKSCLYHKDLSFGGYSKDDIGRLINDIIQQQDNTNDVNIKGENIIDTSDTDFWN